MADRNEERIAGASGPQGEIEVEETIAIRAEIRDTRERMGDTIEEIGDRLNPRHLREQVKEGVRDATIGRVENMAHNAADKVQETRRTIMETVRDNPIPAAMVGIGLGWMYLNSRNDDSRDDYYGRGRDSVGYGGRAAGYGSAYGSRGGYPSGYGQGAGTSGGYGPEEEEGRLGQMRERASEMGHNFKERASELGHEASELGHDVAERTQELAGNVAQRAQDLGHDIADTTRKQVGRVEDRFYESPLMVGAATMALGLAAGFALPRTRTESRIMGPARDQFVEKVKETAEETTEKVKHVAERVVDEAQETAKEAAEDEGLTA
jgi:gas vesicle protein